MESYEIYAVLTKASWAFFVFAFGACVGSLINVIAYRMPLGLNIVTPPSRCPKCETRLMWRENIPILGWIFLRGRCRFCKSKISAEYPIVEFFVAALFLLFYLMWYFVPPSGDRDAWMWLGVDWGQFRPMWTLLDRREMWPRVTWPEFLILVTLLGSLVAMTLIDARHHMIPLQLPWFATIVAVVGHTVHAILIEGKQQLWPPMVNSEGIGQIWFFPTPTTAPGMFAVFGATLGLGVGLLLLRSGLVRRSFADYNDWAEAEQARVVAEFQAANPGVPVPESLAHDGPAMWTAYPHARREMFKELAFLSPCVILGYVGWMLGGQITGTVPNWVAVLAGTLLGYLVGGGIVWVVRIGGSMLFAKEAMGMGDVHLMAAVGAALGWIDATLGFFGAAFVGLGWNLLGMVFSGKLNRYMPYGPYMAAATVLVLLFKPLIVKGLAMLNIYI